jgi:ribosomal protein S18 acetylase RimI-like enzyme
MLEGMHIRTFETDDARWAAEIMERRRQVYAGFSPVFWRPARGVVDLHARFIRRLVADGTNVCLRADHGFVIGQARPPECFVDDFAVDDAGTWEGTGRELLDELWRRMASDAITSVRVVTAKADHDKVAMLRAAGLTLAEQWWVRPLPARPAGTEAAPGWVRGPGFSGLLGPAPPVYDPGGPVLLVERLDGDDIEAIEEKATTMGAVLAIVAAPLGAGYEHQLARREWSVASQWYIGRPTPQRQPNDT